MSQSSLYTLIKSKNRVKLLTLFLTQPDERFYYTEIFKRLSIPHAALQRELKGLTSIGLIKTTKEATIRYYWLNKQFSLYPELKNIIYKTTGLADMLKENLKKIGKLEIAFIYGSVAKNTEDVKSDIDLMFIGEPDYDKLSSIVVKAENKLSREINFTVTSSKEWTQKIRSKGFAYQVNKEPKIFLIGNEDELRKIS